MDTTKSEVYLTMEKETLVKIIDNKRECIKMLKQRIDKAIEYIESECHEFYVNEPHYRGYQIINIEPLLDILKGEDNDSNNINN